jgi:CheY-like chemotaxis protein
MASPGAILVVDDDADNCSNLADILVDLGYRVDTTTDPFRAVEMVERTAYDVALLDLKMPGMDGLELYRAIKSRRASTVALIVTAYASRATADAALTAGAWHVLPKPIDLPALLGLLGEALGQPLVLVVDDDPDLCANLWDLLRERGFRVGLAHDEADAARQLSGGDYRVVLIDMRLPVGDGSSVFRLVRSTRPEARAVVITGHRAETEEAVRRVLAEGAEAVCYKPFDVPELLALLGRLARDGEPGVN